MSGLGTIIGVTIQFAFAALLGFVAWFVWPTTPEWWGLGVVSVIAGLGAFAGASKAMRTAIVAWRKHRAVRAYLRQGRKPGSSKMANLTDLRRAGMVE
jgi:hypothetical protein